MIKCVLVGPRKSLNRPVSRLLSRRLPGCLSRFGNAPQVSDQLSRFTFIEKRRIRLVMLAYDDLDLFQKLATFGCKAKLLPSPVVFGASSDNQFSILEAIDDDHHRRSVDTQDRRQIDLRNPRVAVDKFQDRELPCFRQNDDEPNSAPSAD